MLIMQNQQAANTGGIPPELLDSYFERAETKLNHYTFGRIRKLDVSSQELEELAFLIEQTILRIAQRMYQFDIDGGIRASETVGELSVSYHQQNQSVEADYYQIASESLATTDLLYRGWGD